MLLNNRNILSIFVAVSADHQHQQIRTEYPTKNTKIQIATNAIKRAEHKCWIMLDLP